MKVTHILKDGRRVDDITGHVVKQEDCPVVYHLMDKMNERIIRESKKTNKRMK